MKNYSIRKVVGLIVLVFTILGLYTLKAQPCNTIAGYNYTLGANGATTLASTSTGTTANTQYYWKIGSNNALPIISSSLYTNTITFTFFANSIVQVSLVVTTPLSGTTFCADSIVQTISINNVTCTPLCTFAIQQVTTQAHTWNLIPTFPANLTGVTWSWGDGTFSNSMFPSHTYSNQGNYGISMTCSVSCTPNDFTASTYTFLNRPVKEELDVPVTVNVIQGPSTNLAKLENQEQNISIFPNPNNSNFTINLDGFEIGKEVALSICNILGEEIYTEKFVIDSGAQTKKLELSEAKSGTYFVKLKYDSQMKVEKLLIVK